MRQAIVQSLDLLKTKIATMEEMNETLATGNVIADFNKEQLKIMTEEIDVLIKRILDEEKRAQ